MSKIYVLSDKKVKGAKNLPVFKIEFIKEDIDLSDYDALIFTSKNAISSIDSFNKEWKNLPSYAIAPQTAKIIQDLGGKLEFVSSKKIGDEFAMELIKPLKNKKVLYLRGTKVVSNLVEILNSHQIVCDEKIVYKTVCKKFENKTKLHRNSVIIFSSPSTIKCFLENFLWDESFKAIAIGKTTAKYFPPHIVPEISDDTSLASCVKKALEIQ